MQEPVIVAVPPKGGSLDDVFKKLVALGWLRADLVTEIRRLVKEDKRRIKLEEGLMQLWRAHGGDQAATMRAADAAGHDLDDIGNALRRMRRYVDDDGRTQLSFSPKPAVDQVLAGLRNDVNPLTREASHTLHLELDHARFGRPSRLMFDHCEFAVKVDGIDVHGVLVGTEHEVTPTYLRKHKRDLSLTCYDAFHNTLLDALDTGKVHNWRELMEHLIEANTDVRILGSLGLEDYLGHFILMPEAEGRQVMALGGSRRWNSIANDPKVAALSGKTLLIDAQYEAVYDSLLDARKNKIRFESTTHEIEKACVNDNRCAIYVVRSGATIAMTPGLTVAGEELVTSETIVAVNRERLEHNRGVGALVAALQPTREDRSDRWRMRLSARLGERLL